VIGLAVPALVLLSAVPSVLWLGSRYAAWLDRSQSTAGEADGARSGSSSAPRPGSARSARIASVAVIDDELLVQLVAFDELAPGPSIYWLNARSDEASIEAAERCCAEHSLIRYRISDSALVLLEVGDAIVPMLSSAAQLPPPTV
jgi:hypothetical protein